jgi:hypothetical protein
MGEIGRLSIRRGPGVLVPWGDVARDGVVKAEVAVGYPDNLVADAPGSVGTDATA